MQNLFQDTSLNQKRQNPKDCLHQNKTQTPPKQNSNLLNKNTEIQNPKVTAKPKMRNKKQNAEAA